MSRPVVCLLSLLALLTSSAAWAEAVCPGPLRSLQAAAVTEMASRQKRLEIHDARVEGQLDLSGIKDLRRVDVRCVEFGGPVILDKLQLIDGMQIVHARFREGLSAEAIVSGPLVRLSKISTLPETPPEGAVPRQLNLSGSRFGSGLEILVTDGSFLNVSRVQVKETFHIAGSQLKRLDADGLRAGGINMPGVGIGAAALWGVGIEGDLFAAGATISELDLTGARVDGDVQFEGSEFRQARWGGMRIGGHLRANGMQANSLEAYQVRARAITISNSSFDCRVDLRDMEIAGHANLGHNEFAYGINLSGSHVGRNVALDGSRLKSQAGTKCNQEQEPGKPIPEVKSSAESLSMRHVRVDGNLNLINGKFQEVELVGSKVEGTFDIRGMTSGGLRLTGTRVIDLAEDHKAWQADNIDLRGFVVLWLFAPDDATSMLTRGKEWFAELLGKSKPYSAQPYAMFAGLLEEGGRGDEARFLRSLARKREIDATHEFSLRSAVGWLSGKIAGFGYEAGRLVFIVLVMFGVAVAIVHTDPMSARHQGPVTQAQRGWIARLGWSIGYVLEIMVPFLSIDGTFSKVRNDGVLTPLSRGLLYVIKVAMLIASVAVVAELSGLLTVSPK